MLYGAGGVLRTMTYKANRLLMVSSCQEVGDESHAARAIRNFGNRSLNERQSRRVLSSGS